MKKNLIIAILLMMSLQVTEAQRTLRQQSYPVPVEADEDEVEWQQDIYREVDLMEDCNIGLYSPQDPGKYEEGLFSLLFQLAIEKKIALYKYVIDGNETFTPRQKMTPEEFMEDFHIPFKTDNGTITVEKEDIPAQDVKKYYIRETVYYNGTNSSFRTVVKALCPVVVADDELSDEKVKYPLFWVTYKEICPYLKRHYVIADARNRADIITADDYFILNRYRGKIYKIYNVIGQPLIQGDMTDSLITARQDGAKKEMTLVRENTYNIYLQDEKARKAKGVTPKKKWYQKFPWEIRRKEKKTE